ncbi:glycosyltransferase family 87 protein [Rhodococcus sp. NPDC058521]|uniref:glycosyltransferase family 87 protein n=1 Tax=Rhodococcus sp. NPDC058521 TaxID=3346536 RepID=UPI003660DA91
MMQIRSKAEAHPVATALIAVGTIISLFMIVDYVVEAATGYLMDLSVFRDAGGAFLHGLPLYSDDFPSTSGFRFIYAPFAAILFAPMADVNQTALQVGWCAMNLVLVWWTLKMVFAKLQFQRSSMVALATLGPVLLLEPMRSNFAFGQVNIILMALVVADLTGVIPRRFRGIAIGLATAIKITPGAFLLVLLVRRDFRSVGRSIGAVLATILLGFWVLPDSSKWFWTAEFFSTGRAGPPTFFRNQAITGLLARLGADGMLESVLWGLAVMIVVAATAWAAYRFSRAGEHVVALGIVALGSLLAAPIAVTHHWTYSILLVPLLLAPQYRSWRPLIGIATVIWLIGPNYVLNTETSGWVEGAVVELVGSSQCLIAMVLMVAAVVAAKSRKPVDEAPSVEGLREDVLEPARS